MWMIVSRPELDDDLRAYEGRAFWEFHALFANYSRACAFATRETLDTLDGWMIVFVGDELPPFIADRCCWYCPAAPAQARLARGRA